MDPEAEHGLVEAMLGSAPLEALRMWPVSTAVNRVAATGPELLRPIEPALDLGLA